MLSVKHYGAFYRTRYGIGFVLLCVLRIKRHVLYIDYRKIAMANWSFKCYDDGEEPNLWKAWFDGQSKRVKTKHDSVFDILETMERHQWRLPHVRHLEKGIYEVRLRGLDREWRILGYLESDQVLVVVAIGYHKDDKWTPRGVIGSAVLIKQQIEDGTYETVDCERPKTEAGEVPRQDLSG